MLLRFANTDLRVALARAVFLVFGIFVLPLVVGMFFSASVASASVAAHVPSVGMRFCIKLFAEMTERGEDPYLLIDGPLASVRRQPVTAFASWNASFSPVGLPAGWYKDATFRFGAAEWLLPPGWRGESAARILFVHGSDAKMSALDPVYSGMTTRLANWTRLPVLAFDYPTAPVVPWPQNVRNVLEALSYIRRHGPEGARVASAVYLVSDSEGALLTMQAVLAAIDTQRALALGYGGALAGAADWIRGVVLSSPVVDVACETASMAYNCWDARRLTGDPDVGNCTGFPTLASRVAWCRWTYLGYFFGFAGLASARTAADADREWRARRAFFETADVSPLHADLSGFPPLLLLSGTEDYYYSDAPRLAARARAAGVPTVAVDAVGGFHDYIEYSGGCGGADATTEAHEAYAAVAELVRAGLNN